MLLHIKLTGLSDETLGSKIHRAIFRNSSVPVKKKSPKRKIDDTTSHLVSNSRSYVGWGSDRIRTHKIRKSWAGLDKDQECGIHRLADPNWSQIFKISLLPIRSEVLKFRPVMVLGSLIWGPRRGLIFGPENCLKWSNFLCLIWFTNALLVQLVALESFWAFYQFGPVKFQMNLGLYFSDQDQSDNYFLKVWTF